MLLYTLIMKVNIFKIINIYIVNTVLLNDSLAKGRFGVWKDGLTIVVLNPFGIRLGNVGLRSQQHYQEKLDYQLNLHI